MKKLITAESVTMGHPDKLCDYIADSILDEALKVDPNARVACEVMASKGEITVAGEITMNGSLPYDDIVNNALAEVGYNPMDFSQHFNIHEQSLDIKNGVDTSLEKRNGQTKKESLGAGDQGVVFGYACKETPELMPMPIMLAHRLAKQLHIARLQNSYTENPPLRPDGKTQVTVEYNEQGPTKADTVIVSTQHSEDIADADLQSLIVNEVIQPTLGTEPLDDALILINPSGRFVEGGPSADTGLTGRKLMVDSYGGGHHGGGAFSGKDPTKVDRSGAYMARYIAKAVVMAGIADRCEVQIAYAIGKAQPVGFYVDTFGQVNDEELTEVCGRLFDKSPGAIIERFDLRRPIYKMTAAYGHFGNEALPWEQVSGTDIEDLKLVWFGSEA